MTYLSQLLGRPVLDALGTQVGVLQDVLASGLDRQFPYVRALAIRQDGKALIVGANQLGDLEPKATLKSESARIRPYAPRGDELWLSDRIMDHQIVDTEGRRVVRVNDVELAPSGGAYLVMGIDVGALGLLRRLGLEKPARALAGKRLSESIIPWEDVAPLADQDAVHLKISRDKISKLHPADIAALLSDLDARAGQDLARVLDDETLADTMEEAPPDVQSAILTAIGDERAADILEEMAPDEAADAVAELPTAQGEQLLGLMADEESQEVQRLLGYPEDSAGGIMTTEFASVPLGLTAHQALSYLRESPVAHEDEAMYNVYVVDDAHHLRRVISLRDLVMMPPDAVLDEASAKPISVTPQTPSADVAFAVAKYNLLAVPVLDDEGVMLGIVTVDDAIDTVLPTAWKRRLPRFY
jgi:magnesium transporter